MKTKFQDSNLKTGNNTNTKRQTKIGNNTNYCEFNYYCILVDQTQTNKICGISAC